MRFLLNDEGSGGPQKKYSSDKCSDKRKMFHFSIYLCGYKRYPIFKNRSALAVNCCLIIHCLEVSCKEDQNPPIIVQLITSGKTIRFRYDVHLHCNTWSYMYYENNGIFRTKHW